MRFANQNPSDSPIGNIICVPQADVTEDMLLEFAIEAGCEGDITIEPPDLVRALSAAVAIHIPT